jgi:hypothetical protein
LNTGSPVLHPHLHAALVNLLLFAKILESLGKKQDKEKGMRRLMQALRTQALLSLCH